MNRIFRGKQRGIDPWIHPLEKLLVFHLNDLFLLFRVQVVETAAALLPQAVSPFSCTQGKLTMHHA